MKQTLSQYGLCAELDGNNEAVKMRTCSGQTNQQWTVEDASGGKRFQNVAVNDKCITDKKVGGPVVGMDPGVDVQAGLAESCGQVPADQIQSFTLTSSNGKSFPEGFHIQTASGDCMIPVGADIITFDAVAFETPTGEVSIIAMNLGEADLAFEIYDTASKSGAKNVTVPMHGITSFRLNPTESHASSVYV